MMFVEFSIEGILLILIILGMDVVQQEVAVGNDIAHVLGLLSIVEQEAIDNFLGTPLDSLYILRVLALSEAPEKEESN